MKKILAASFIGAVLFFNGCASDDGEDRLETQYMLDNGEYNAVVLKLEGNADSEDEYLALASAYMGKSGLGLSDMVSLMADSSGTDGFGGLASAIGKDNDTLVNIGKATDNYKLAANGACDSNATVDPTNSQKDICLFMGLSSMMKAATTLSYLGDLESFGTTAVDGPNYELTASACAMGYAFNGTYDTTDCTLVGPEANVEFDSNKTYTPFAMLVNATNYYYLKTTDSVVPQTIITDGNCTTAFTACTTASDVDCYVCPVNQDADAEELTVANILVDVINDGVESIVATLGLDSDITADVEAFKEELSGSVDGNITVESIINYIDANNL